MAKDAEPVVVKKYANRRLYHTGTSTYVTLDDLAEMVRRGEEFVVQDAKTGEDITRGVLGQIIFDAEGRGAGLLPIAFLRQLITLYDGQMQALVPAYLEQSLATFGREQDKLRRQMSDAFGTKAFDVVEDQVRANMDMFQRSIRMFMPFAQEPTAASPPPPKETPKPAADDPLASDVAALRGELAKMQAQLNSMSRDDAPASPASQPEPAAQENESENDVAAVEPQPRKTGT